MLDSASFFPVEQGDETSGSPDYARLRPGYYDSSPKGPDY